MGLPVISTIPVVAGDCASLVGLPCPRALAAARAPSTSAAGTGLLSSPAERAPPEWDFGFSKGACGAPKRASSAASAQKTPRGDSLGTPADGDALAAAAAAAVAAAAAGRRSSAGSFCGSGCWATGTAVATGVACACAQRRSVPWSSAGGAAILMRACFDCWWGDACADCSAAVTAVWVAADTATAGAGAAVVLAGTVTTTLLPRSALATASPQRSAVRGGVLGARATTAAVVAATEDAPIGAATTVAMLVLLLIGVAGAAAFFSVER
mmetsp:Transcript_4297/g.17269  ORF Transcript_4297/g.17269 Transcript_4297/m.17269 type:complete len:268 (+) Transcript_4297:812-1615(+)